MELIGVPVSELDTPVALLDLDLFERNATQIHQFLSDRGRAWRPHSKAHKSPLLARRQIDIGAVGVTCAKVSEAEVMVEGGITDVLIANELGTPAKWRRVAALQRRAKVAACVDDEAHVRWASAGGAAEGTTVPVVIEMDLGMHRVGVASELDALRLADLIAAAPGVRLAGVMGYEGHLLNVWPEEDKVSQCEQALDVLVSAAELLRRNGHQVEVVSSGGTGAYEASGAVGGVTESQAGGGCLMDRFYAEDCHVDLAHALTLSTTVVSVQFSGQAVVDAGFKALGRLPGLPLPRVLDRPGVEFAALSAEHGILALHGASMRVGEQLRVIPGYSDAMLFLHNNLIGHRGGVVTEIIPLLARGLLT